jgi:hypothetical protein
LWELLHPPIERRVATKGSIPWQIARIPVAFVLCAIVSPSAELVYSKRPPWAKLSSATLSSSVKTSAARPISLFSGSDSRLVLELV